MMKWKDSSTSTKAGRLLKIVGAATQKARDAVTDLTWFDHLMPPRIAEQDIDVDCSVNM